MCWDGKLEAGCVFFSIHSRHLGAEAEEFCGSEIGCRVDTVALGSAPHPDGQARGQTPL